MEDDTRYFRCPKCTALKMVNTVWCTKPEELTICNTSGCKNPIAEITVDEFLYFGLELNRRMDSDEYFLGFRAPGTPRFTS